MQIQFNGDNTEVREGLTLSALLSDMQINPSQVAVMIDDSVVSRDSFDETVLTDGCCVEALTYAGGG